MRKGSMIWSLKSWITSPQIVATPSAVWTWTFIEPSVCAPAASQ